MNFKLVIYISIFILLLFSACSEKKNQAKVAKNVPNRYVNALKLHYVLDTVYEQQKPFTGIAYALYPNGDTAFTKPCYAGLLEGYAKSWYENGQLNDIRFYIDGKKEGIHKGWWPDGRRKFVYQFDNDEFNGLVKEWFTTGALFKEFHLVKGYEEGSQKMWWINGKIKANYIIKDGRRYGLLGTKNCVNVADSVFRMP